MSRLPHLLPRDTAFTEQYKSTRSGGGEFHTPPRDARERHGAELLDQLSAVASDAESRFGDAAESDILGAPIEFVSDPGFRLRLESLEQEKKGIHILNVRVEDDVMRATADADYARNLNTRTVLSASAHIYSPEREQWVADPVMKHASFRLRYPSLFAQDGLSLAG